MCIQKLLNIYILNINIAKAENYKMFELVILMVWKTAEQANHKLLYYIQNK